MFTTYLEVLRVIHPSTRVFCRMQNYRRLAHDSHIWTGFHDRNAFFFCSECVNYVCSLPYSCCTRVQSSKLRIQPYFPKAGLGSLMHTAWKPHVEQCSCRQHETIFFGFDNINSRYKNTHVNNAVPAEPLSASFPPTPEKKLQPEPLLADFSAKGPSAFGLLALNVYGFRV